MGENIWKWCNWQGIISKIYKQLMYLKTFFFLFVCLFGFFSGQKISTDISLNKKYRWPKSTQKDVQRCQLFEKCKAKLQISPHVRMLSSKCLQIINAGRLMEKRKTSYTVIPWIREWLLVRMWISSTILQDSMETS